MEHPSGLNPANWFRNDFWFPEQASSFAARTDWTYWFISYTSLVFFVLIMAFMAYFCIIYRRRKGHHADPGEAHNNLLETAWTVGPAVLVVLMFYWGFVDFIDMRTMPEQANQIDVVGQKWFWKFRYANGKAEESGQVDGNGERAIWSDRSKIVAKLPKLHVIVNEPTVLTMSSGDVLHSFFIPSFRTKQDVVPGRYTKMWFLPEKVGTYDVFCAEYCGDKHSEMLAQVVVETREEFNAWFEKASNILDLNGGDLVKAGAYLYDRRGCKQCHSLDGSSDAKVGGPSFLGGFGKEFKLTDGTTVMMDENYIKESILYPQNKIHEGFGPIMAGGLITKPEQIDWIIAFIRDLNQKKTSE